MSRSAANLLRAFCLWTVWVWITRIVNIVGDDHSLGFTVVHSLLALISIAFAVAAWIVVARVRRSARRTGRAPDDAPGEVEAGIR